MRFDTKNISVFNKTLMIPVPYGYEEQMDDVLRLLKDGKEITVKIEQKRKNRSMNANAMMWVLLNNLAVKLHTSAWEVYLEMLRKYGSSTFMKGLPETENHLKKQFRIVVDRGETTMNDEGVKGRIFQLYWGSSTYDTKEFSHLLEGVISECKEQGIEYLSDEDRDMYMREYAKERGETYGK